MAWYENPVVSAVLGGLAGAIATGIVSLYIWRKTHKIRRIDCAVGDVSSLLAFSEKIKDKLEVKFEGRDVRSVHMISLEFSNTGTEAITEQPVNIRLSEGAQVVDYTVRTVPEVGFGDIREKRKEGNALDLEIELLNPDDRVEIEIVSLDNSSDEVKVYMKNANVESRVYTAKSAQHALIGALSDREMVALAALSSLPLFGGFARSLMTIALAKRIDKVAEKKRDIT